MVPGMGKGSEEREIAMKDGDNRLSHCNESNWHSDMRNMLRRIIPRAELHRRTAV